MCLVLRLPARQRGRCEALLQIGNRVFEHLTRAWENQIARQSAEDFRTFGCAFRFHPINFSPTLNDQLSTLNSLQAVKPARVAGERTGVRESIGRRQIVRRIRATDFSATRSRAPPADAGAIWKRIVALRNSLPLLLCNPR
jgi:hypothetical protein